MSTPHSRTGVGATMPTARPRMTLPISGPCSGCRRGKAKPRQPGGSSPSGPPRTNVAAKAGIGKSHRRRQRLVRRRYPGKTSAPSSSLAGMTRYHRSFTRHSTYRRSRRSTPARPRLPADVSGTRPESQQQQKPGPRPPRETHDQAFRVVGVTGFEPATSLSRSNLCRPLTCAFLQLKAAWLSVDVRPDPMLSGAIVTQLVTRLVDRLHRSTSLRRRQAPSMPAGR